MFSNRVFMFTFIISLAAHVIILSQNPDFQFFPTQKKQQDLEVRYVKQLKDVRTQSKPQAQRKMDPFLKLTPKIKAEKRTPPPFVDRDNILGKLSGKIRVDSDISKPPAIKPAIVDIKKKITFPPVDLNKLDNPSYLNYYQIVREKIRRAAYFNYTHTETGEVYVSFVISADGTLPEAKLVEEKSTQNVYLRNIALRSVRDAVPFPAFPKELDYPTLSFNVVIYFEIEYTS